MGNTCSKLEVDVNLVSKAVQEHLSPIMTAKPANVKWKIASLSDIHMAHPKVSAENIFRGFRAAFPDNETTAQLDIIFIAGDLFDRLITRPHPDSPYIDMWINYTLRLCAKYDIKLRILEGTPSHDWRQSAGFVTANDCLDQPADLVYADKLMVEHIEDLDMTVLYIPDELNHDNDVTWKQVNELLATHGLKKVDFIVMHGFFEFHLPRNIPLPHHRADRYMSICNHHIFIGHHHSMRQYKAILGHGSFDRTGHGEEEPKGHFRVTVKHEGNTDIQFVENRHATRFDTLDCKGMELKEGQAAIIEKFESMPEGSRVRINATRGSELALALPEIRAGLKHLGIGWDEKIEGENPEAESVLKLKSTFKAVRIDKVTVTELLASRMANEGHPPELVDLSKTLLEGVL